MINKSTYCTKLSVDEHRILIGAKIWSGKKWDNKSPVNNDISAIKVKLRSQLSLVQKQCAYCGLKLGGTSKGQIEHIAPKAAYRYPQFTFTLKNLVLACDFCNGFEKKGTSNTIDQIHRVYSKCVFNIVHPYFDDPDDHYEWVDNDIELLIQVKNGSIKALNSMKLFDLESTMMNEFRAQQIRFDERKRQYYLSQSDENLIELIINK